MTPDRRSIDGLQHLRWWAAGLVVLYHAARLKGAEGYTGLGQFEFLAAGTFGVQLFFVISGFIITVTCLNADGSAKLSIAEFARRRFARIVPILWVAVLVYNGLKLAATGSVDWLEMFRSLTLWPVGTFDPGVVWTLRLEAIFYVLFATTMLVRPKWRWLLALWVVAPIFARVLSGIVPQLAGPYDNDPAVWVFLMGHQAGANLQFGVGVLLGLAWNAQSPLLRRPLKLGGLAIFSAVVAGVILTELVARTLLGELAAILISTLLCALVVILSVRAQPATNVLNHAFHRLGDASYAIYLFHVIILMVAARMVGPAQLHMSSWVYWLMLFVGAVSSCFLVHRFIEAPLVKWVSAHLRPARPPASPRAA